MPLDINFRCAIGLFSLLNSDFLSVSGDIGGVFERMQKHAADAEACRKEFLARRRRSGTCNRASARFSSRPGQCKQPTHCRGTLCWITVAGRRNAEQGIPRVVCVYMSLRRARRLSHCPVCVCYCAMSRVSRSTIRDTVTTYLIYYSDFGVCPTAHRPFHASFYSLVLLFPVLWPALYLVLRPAPMITTWPLPAAGAFSFSSLFYVLFLIHWSDTRDATWAHVVEIAKMMGDGCQRCRDGSCLSSSSST